MNHHFDSGRLARLALNDEGFAFDPRTGESFTLNPSGRQVLRGLAGGADPESVAAALAERFAIGLNGARADVRDFVEQLRALRLVEVQS